MVYLCQNTIYTYDIIELTSIVLMSCTKPKEQKWNDRYMHFDTINNNNILHASFKRAYRSRKPAFKPDHFSYSRISV